MILDADRFLENERPIWDELAAQLERLENNPTGASTVAELERFHYLYQRTASGLARLQANSGDSAAMRHVEMLVARAYAEIHQRATRPGHWRRTLRAAWQWLSAGFPQTFRRQSAAFGLSLALTIAGCGFGATVLVTVPDSKATLLPFSHLQDKPSVRVSKEEAEQKNKPDRMRGKKTTFAAELMTHNIKVAILTMAMGATWGLGVVTLLFYNGVILGAVLCDYIRDGQLVFALAWLMPHGVIEIPAILVGGQAGFVLAGALVGWNNRESRRRRLAAVRNDLASLAGGMAVMLVWAGIVESFLSQYHQPVLPYPVKIAMGCVELGLLCAWLGRGGKRGGA